MKHVVEPRQSLSKFELPVLPVQYLQLHYFTSEITHKRTWGSIQNGCGFPLAIDSPFFAEISNSAELTSGTKVKKVVDICFDVTNSGFQFLPGDTVGIIPCNSKTDIDKVLKYLRVQERAETLFHLTVKPGITKKNAHVPEYIPTKSTLRHVLETCLEIRSIPKKVFLRVLAEHTSNAQERWHLEELSSRQGSADYTQHILEAGATLLDILEEFPSCCPPVERLFEYLPRLRARPYSIASSPLAYPGAKKLHIVYSQVEEGVCTSWLDSVLHQHVPDMLADHFSSLRLQCPQVPMFLRENRTFRIPENCAVPLILIGPGTGIAPFIGFLQHRACQLEHAQPERYGDVWLFFGCRYSDQDFIFRERLERYLEDGILTKLFVSFSRETTSDKIKYVQDNIRIHRKDFVVQLMEKNSMIFVCGDARSMAKDVCNTIINVIAEEKGVPKEDAAAVVENMKADGKYLEDIWS